MASSLILEWLVPAIHAVPLSGTVYASHAARSWCFSESLSPREQRRGDSWPKRQSASNFDVRSASKVDPLFVMGAYRLEELLPWNWLPWPQVIAALAA
jgi:hypothetical protein